MYVLHDDYSPLSDQYGQADKLRKVTARGLFLMMGKGLEELEEVPSGNLLAIYGVDEAVLRSATLSTSEFSTSLNPLSY